MVYPNRWKVKLDADTKITSRRIIDLSVKTKATNFMEKKITEKFPKHGIREKFHGKNTEIANH